MSVLCALPGEGRAPRPRLEWLLCPPYCTANKGVSLKRAGASNAVIRVRPIGPGLGRGRSCRPHTLQQRSCLQNVLPFEQLIWFLFLKGPQSLLPPSPHPPAPLPAPLLCALDVPLGLRRGSAPQVAAPCVRGTDFPPLCPWPPVGAQGWGVRV